MLPDVLSEDSYTPARTLFFLCSGRVRNDYTIPLRTPSSSRRVQNNDDYFPSFN